MSAQSQRQEISVGLFVLVGFLLLGWLMLQFAKSGGDPGGGYPVTVEVRDASGVRVGVPVRLGGIDIGSVASMPTLNSESTMIEVPLTIFPGTKIPEGSQVQIATSGLMGDSFVRILPPTVSTGNFIEEGARIRASETSTITDLTNDAGSAISEVETTMTEIRDSVKHLNEIFTRIENGVLHEQNLSNLSELLAEMRTLSGQLKTTTEEFGPLLDDTTQAIQSVNEAAGAANTTFATANTTFATVDGTMKEFRATLGTINPAVTEFDESLDSLRRMIAAVNGLVTEIDKGDGLAAALINDQELKKDLEEFVTKLNKNGVLFYPREHGILDRGQTNEKRKPFSPPAERP